MDLVSHALLESYFEVNPPGDVHIASYNHFVQHVIPHVIANTAPIDIRQNLSGKQNATSDTVYRKRPVIFSIQFSNVRYGLPGSRNEHGEGQHGQTPMEARLRSSNYMMPMFADVELCNAKQQRQVHEHIYLGHVPVMVGSCMCTSQSETAKRNTECENDPGGYFIVNGMERMVIMQEKMSFNMVFVNQCKSGVFKSCHYAYEAEVRCSLQEFNTTTSTFRIAVRRDEPWEFSVSLPYVKYTFSWYLLLRALCIPVDDLLVLVRATWYNHTDTHANDAWIEHVLDQMRTQYETVCREHTQEAVLDMIATSFCAPAISVYTMRENLRKELLPHVSQRADQLYAKGLMVVQLATRVLLTMRGLGTTLDKDHYGFKRVQTSGEKLAELFRTAWCKLCKEVRAGVRKHISHHKVPDVIACIRPSTITHAFTYAISTGNWNKSGGRQSDNHVGISQVLNRFTAQAALSYRTRINVNMGKEGKLSKPRRVHTSQHNYICPSETPEGQTCGLVKNMALLTRITLGHDPDRAHHALVQFGVMPLRYVHSVRQLRIDVAWGHVMVNGAWFGVHHDLETLCEQMRAWRRANASEWDVGVYLNRRARYMTVRTDGGRVTFPALRVVYDEHGGKSVHPLVLGMADLVQREHEGGDAWGVCAVNKRRALVDMCKRTGARAILHEERDAVPSLFDFFERAGAIEWIDGMEQENMMVAYTLEELQRDDTPFTHMQIEPASFLGFCVFAIPGANHNQAPRNTYQAAMGKQGISPGASNFDLRFDTLVHRLHYAQKPLVCTKLDTLRDGGGESPAGENCIVAIIAEADNQEDSIRINRAAIDRGLFRSSYYHTLSSEAKRTQHVQDQFEVPPPAIRRYNADAYRHLDVDGLPHVGARLEPGDVVVGKTRTYRNDKEHKLDYSLVLRNNESYYVDGVMVTTNDLNSDENPLVRVRLRGERVPEKGDKFSSRHGQKGVCGAVVPQEDMPFTQDGIVPDIVVNSHAFPSRMTIAQLWECVLSKLGVFRGGQLDFTPFGMTDKHLEDLAEGLRAFGYDPMGTERMYDGCTGMPLQSRVFIGPTFYQRLRHMVRDKNHARATGPIEILTRQPVEGRAKNGGLRLGEMERDAILAHGAPAFLRDRMLDNSDRYEVDVCSKCGVFASPRFDSPHAVCPKCHDYADVKRIAIPYCTKLMTQELEAAHIGMRIRVQAD